MSCGAAKGTSKPMQPYLGDVAGDVHRLPPIYKPREPERDWFDRTKDAVIGWLAVMFYAGLVGAWLLAVFMLGGRPASGHSWYPPQCCSGHDCRSISQDDVKLTPEGFKIKESGEVIPYGDNRIRKTPPEGQAKYHRCSEGGKPEGKTICIYIPNWQF